MKLKWQRPPAAFFITAAIVWTAPYFLTGCKENPEQSQSSPPIVIVTRAKAFNPSSGAEKAGIYLAVVRPANEFTASFKSGGVLDTIGPSPAQDWKEGTAVTKGNLLARLVQSDFSNQVKIARSKYDLAVSEFNRGSQLYEAANISRQEFNTMEASLKSAGAELNLARQALADSEIRAPFAGNIIARQFSAGETVAAGQSVLKFGNMQNVQIDVGVPDTLIARMAAGMKIPVKFPAIPEKEFNGEVCEVGIAAHDETRLFKVAIKVDNGGGLLRSGMTAMVNFILPRVHAAGGAIVPVAALFVSDQTSGQASVYIVESNSVVRLRNVATAEIIDNNVLITSGVNAGEDVVVSGVSDLYDGVKVKTSAYNELIY